MKYEARAGREILDTERSRLRALASAWDLDFYVCVLNASYYSYQEQQIER